MQSYTWIQVLVYLCSNIICFKNVASYPFLDSIIYTDNGRLTAEPPVGEELGVYKDEIDNDDQMEEFATCGPKNYAYRTRKNKTCLKVKGISLNFRATKALHFASVKHMALSKGTAGEILVDMGSTIARNKTAWTLHTRPNCKKYCFRFDKRRVQKRSTRTLPWGYVYDGSTPPKVKRYPLK